MNRNWFTTIAGILLILYALENLSASFDKYNNADGSVAVATESDTVQATNSTPRQTQTAGFNIICYAVACFIFLTALIQLTASVGFATGKAWTFSVLIVAVLFGFIIEIQDIVDNGLYPQKLALLGIGGFALVTGILFRQKAGAPVSKKKKETRSPFDL